MSTKFNPSLRIKGIAGAYRSLPHKEQVISQPLKLYPSSLELDRLLSFPGLTMPGSATVETQGRGLEKGRY